MAHKAPGKSHRKGISLIEIMQKFSDDTIAEAWFIEREETDAATSGQEANVTTMGDKARGRCRPSIF